MPKATAPEVRFFRHVRESDDCWLWTGGTDRRGYGIFHDGISRRAHRWSYEYFRAEIPDGLHLDHLCRTPSCVNPWHLEPVTPLVNTSRGLLGELHTGKCRHGHDFEPWKPGEKRYCKTCAANAWANRPAHLRPLRPRSERTSCRHGHELTPDNVYVRPADGFKVCRTCERTRSRARVDN